MAQKIKQANIFGRLGSALSQGVESSFDKGMERGELASDLKRLQNEDMSKLTPTQRLLKSSTPATLQHPQFIQSLGRLAEQEARGEAAKGFSGAEDKTQIPNFLQKEESKSGEQAPSITRGDILSDIQKGAIPPTKQEEYKRAVEIYEPNKQFFKHDINNALQFVESETQREQDRLSAKEKLDKKLFDIQGRVKDTLEKHSEKLNVKVPANVYQDIQSKAQKAVLPKSDGGRGLTEEQAAVEFSKELDEISREYSDLNDIGGWGIQNFKNDKQAITNLKTLQKSFEERGDTRNMGDALIANEFSPPFSYSVAEPIAREPKLNEAMKKIPDLAKPRSFIQPMLGASPIKGGGIPIQEISPEVKREKTLSVMPQILENMGTKGSPLAVMYELEKKGYDAQSAKDYFLDNENKLTGLQVQQLRKTEAPYARMNDIWLKSWTGIKE